MHPFSHRCHDCPRWRSTARPEDCSAVQHANHVVHNHFVNIPKKLTKLNTLDLIRRLNCNREAIHVSMVSDSQA